MSEQTGYKYDVFISYDPSDWDWVRRNVLRWLEGVGLDVIVKDRNFVAGISATEHIKSAITQSRHTVAVITPRWISNAQTESERSQAIAAGLRGREPKLIPLIGESCDLPLDIYHLNFLDFRDRTRWGDEKIRLFHTVRAQPPLVDEFNVCEVVIGLEVLCGSMNVLDVFRGEGSFQACFRTSSGQFRNLRNYKAVHGLLHELQCKCHDPLVREERYIPDDESSLENLRCYECTLQEKIDALRELTGRSTFAGFDASWIQRLERSRQKLNTVIESVARDQSRLVRSRLSSSVVGFRADVRRVAREQLKDVARQLDREIGLHLAWVHACLRGAATALRLDELGKTLGRVHTKLAQSGLDREKLSELHDGLDALVGLNQRLTDFVIRQTKWQNMDSELRNCKNILGSSRTDGLEDAWKRVKGSAEWLRRGQAEAGVDMLAENGKRLDNILAEHRYAKFADDFMGYRRTSNRRFYYVDVDLNMLCESLVRIAGPLDSIVEKLGG